MDDNFWDRFRRMAREQERLAEEQGGGLLIPDCVPEDVVVEELQKGSKSVFWVPIERARPKPGGGGRA